MKKLVIIFLLSVPVFAMAQENLIGKTRAEVKAYFKKTKLPLFISDEDDGYPSDEFKDADNQVTCLYDKKGICKKELAEIPYTKYAALLASLKKGWDKIDDDSWGNKTKTVKVQIFTQAALQILSLDYVAYDMPFVGRVKQ
ncbi:MAG TPA: hypothetical protein VFE53_08530 [Mucilaginibacter sp.]|jgi:hypothetical protein|nr:hypothetical protein [Mucilaginibacter sp.]